MSLRFNSLRFIQRFLKRGLPLYTKKTQRNQSLNLNVFFRFWESDKSIFLCSMPECVPRTKFIGEEGFFSHLNSISKVLSPARVFLRGIMVGYSTPKVSVVSSNSPLSFGLMRHLGPVAAM